MAKTKPNYGTKKENTMGTTRDTGSVKQGYPRGTEEGDGNYKEYIDYNNPLADIDPRISGEYYPEVKEDDYRINRNDPLRRKPQEIISDDTREMYIKNTSHKLKKVMESPICEYGEIYHSQIENVDNYGNAIVVIEGSDLKGILYNAKKLGVKPGEMRDLLFARKNKKGKLVFELPKNSEDIVAQYYDLYADGLSQEDVIQQLISKYGSKNVKENLIGIVGNKVWKELTKVA